MDQWHHKWNLLLCELFLFVGKLQLLVVW